MEQFGKCCYGSIGKISTNIFFLFYFIFKLYITVLKLQYQNTFDLIAYLLILVIDFCYK